MFGLCVRQNIIINNVSVIIDIFISSKYDSLVVIFNNYNHIKNKTSIDVDKTSITYNNNILKYTLINNYNDFNTIENVNCKKYFNKRFHHDIIIIKDFTTRTKMDTYNIEIKLHDSVDNVIFTKLFNILNIPSIFENKKCMTTIHLNEYHLIPSWIDYHKKIGFEKFIIYDNKFDKLQNDKLINMYKNELYIINANWTYYLNSYGNNTVGQCIQQNHCLWKFSPKFLALTDLDEYINIKDHDKIFNEDISVLSIPNYFFGCCNNITYTYDNFIQQLTKRETSRNELIRRKCIIQSKYVDLFCVHIPVIWFNDINYLSFEYGYLNHYIYLNGKRKQCNCKIYCIETDNSIL